MKIFYHSDHLGSASFVTNIDGYVMQHLQYLPYGELFVSQRNSEEFDSRYKFTAKELDNETSYTYFGARYYDSELSGWLSVDPMSDKYPSTSSYMYCSGNPVILIDPNGLEIVITGEDGEKITYNQGMEYNGKDEFTNKTIKILNQMNSTEIGGQVLGELVGSENQFNITNTFAKDKDGNEVKNALSFAISENGGGEIHAGVLMGDNMQEGQKLESIAHELFHGYQYEKGQTLNGSLATVNNEVGAYLFGRAVYYSYNRDKGFATMPWGNGTQAGDSYENAMNSLIWAPSFNYSQYSTAVNNFKAGSSVNVSETGVPGQGFYRNFKTDTNLKNPLIKNFFPLVR